MSTHRPEKNVLGSRLQNCCETAPGGFYRDGFCRTGPEDIGSHTICVQITAAFLAFSKKHGNDLSTPYPEYDFPGLTPGDRWCVCATRWEQAFLVGKAPPVILEATHENALEVVSLEELQARALTGYQK